MGDDLIDLSLEGRVAYLRFNRPEKCNAFSVAMIEDLRRSLIRATEASDFLLIAAAGDDFSIGRDRDETVEMSRREILALIGNTNTLLVEYPGIIVAAVRGRALGYGCGLAVQCDLVIAGESTVFAFNEISGGAPPLIVMSYLGEYLARRTVLDLVLTGRQVIGKEAQQIGMTTRTVPEIDVEREAEAVVRQLCLANTQALRRVKKYAREIETVPRVQRTRYALAAQEKWFSEQEG